MQSDDEAMEVKPRRPSGGRSGRGYAAADNRPQRSSRRAAAAGVAYAVAAAAAAGEGGQYDNAGAAVYGAVGHTAASPPPSGYAGSGLSGPADSAGAAVSGGGRSKGGSKARGRGSSRGRSRDDSEDLEDWDDEESDDVAADDDEEGDVCGGRFVSARLSTRCWYHLMLFYFYSFSSRGCCFCFLTRGCDTVVPADRSIPSSQSVLVFGL